MKAIGSQRIPTPVQVCGWLAMMLLGGISIERWATRIPPEPPDQLAESADDMTFGSRSPDWPRVRAAVLRHNPTCAACGSVEEMNVHHIIPYHENPGLELVTENLIPLCRTHHFFIGHDPDGPEGPKKPDWKKSNPLVRRDAARHLRKVKR
jgi:hypothetical protein